MTRLANLRVGPPKRLTAVQVAKFDCEGFLLPMLGCSSDDASAIRMRIEEREKALQKAGNAHFLNAHLQYKWWLDLCTRPEILTVVTDLLGPNVLIWKSQLWIKEPGDAYVGWHQDATYWGLEPPDSVNVWIALTDVMQTHGPLELLAGSQATALPTRDTYSVDNILTRGQDIDWDAAGGLDERKVTKAVLRPGEFSIHHLCTAHASKPNGGPGRRIGFNVTFVAPHVKSIRPDGSSAMLVCGVDTHGNFDYDAKPSGDVPTLLEEAAVREKNEGVSRSLLAGADMEKFAAVSSQRSTRNLPPHVKSGGEGAFGVAIRAKL